MVLSVEVKCWYQRASFDSSETDGHESLLARVEELTWDFASGRETLSEMLFVSAVLAMRASDVLCKLLKLKKWRLRGSRTIQGVDTKQVIDSLKCHKPLKRPHCRIHCPIIVRKYLLACFGNATFTA